MNPTNQKFGLLTASIAAGLIGLSLLRIHLRVKATMIGYEIGRVKKDEVELRERNGELNMLLAKVSSLKHLNMMMLNKDLPPNAVNDQVAFK